MSRREKVQSIFEKHWPSMARAYEHGITPKEIADKFGISPSTMARKLIKEGYRHKKKGRYPTALQERSRDLFSRGWPASKIALFLEVPREKIVEWLEARIDAQSEYSNQRKKNPAPKASKEATQVREKSSVPRHVRGRRWTEEQKEFVFKLINGKWPPYEIYRIANASKARQRQIWKELGGKGSPPNLVGIEEIIEKKKKRRKELGKKIEEAVVETVEEKELVPPSKLAETAEKVKKATPTILTKIEPEAPGTPEKRRVMPGSYEADVMKLPVGSIITQDEVLSTSGKKTRVRKVKAPKQIKEFADNKNYFEISRKIRFIVEDDEGQKRKINFENFKPDDLALAADTMSSWGVPTQVSKNAGLPNAYIDETMPDRFVKQYALALKQADDVVKLYQKLKTSLKNNNTPPAITEYLGTAFQAFGSSGLQPSEREVRKRQLSLIWRNLSDVERAALIFHLRAAYRNGSPTDRGIGMGSSASKAILQAQQKEMEKVSKEAQQQKQAGKFGYGIYANNKNQFSISTSWPGLAGESEAELRIRAASLSANKFPTVYSKSGTFPKSFEKGIAPKEVIEEFKRAFKKSESLRNEYRLRKLTISRAGLKVPGLSKFDSGPAKTQGYISKYMVPWFAQSAALYSDSDIGRQTAREKIPKIWAKIPQLDRMILSFDFGVAEPETGLPTERGIEIARRLVRQKPVSKKEVITAKAKQISSAQNRAELSESKAGFQVSNAWRRFESDNPAELQLRAIALSQEGFPSKVTLTGKEPDNVFEWPLAAQQAYAQALRKGKDYVKKYNEIKREFIKKREFMPKQREFFKANAIMYDARQDINIRKKTKQWLENYFREASPALRMFLIYDLKAYAENGAPRPLKML